MRQSAQKKLTKNAAQNPNVVYVVGAGLSAGLGFPTTHDLLRRLWLRLRQANLDNGLAAIIRFHHPEFNPSRPSTFPNIEQLLSEMQANEQLFESSRPATGNFTTVALEQSRRALLLELARWFHELKSKVLSQKPRWLNKLVRTMKMEKARIVSFNWDLILDHLLFGETLNPGSYGFGRQHERLCLIKPHGSINWYEHASARTLNEEKKFRLIGKGREACFAFRPYRAPKSRVRDREYMPLIIPPVYSKQFDGPLFKHLWQQAVSALSRASEVRFLGYSLPEADFHARFILRCGFYNQEHGELQTNGIRTSPTGRAKVVIVDPDSKGPDRIETTVGWKCQMYRKTVEDWVAADGLSNNV